MNVPSLTFRPLQGRREKFVVATKFGIWYDMAAQVWSLCSFFARLPWLYHVALFIPLPLCNTYWIRVARPLNFKAVDDKKSARVIVPLCLLYYLLTMRK